MSCYLRRMAQLLLMLLPHRVASAKLARKALRVPASVGLRRVDSPSAGEAQ